jgi:hypothetical protein
MGVLGSLNVALRMFSQTITDYGGSRGNHQIDLENRRPQGHAGVAPVYSHGLRVCQSTRASEASGRQKLGGPFK